MLINRKLLLDDVRIKASQTAAHKVSCSTIVDLAGSSQISRVAFLGLSIHRLAAVEAALLAQDHLSCFTPMRS